MKTILITALMLFRIGFAYAEGPAPCATRAEQSKLAGPALKAFIEATKPAEGARGDHMVKFDRDEQRTTLQRLDDMQARLAEQQAAASRRIAAVRTFYGQLDAKQKKAFDALPMLMMVGPSMGPMMLPHPMRIAQHMPPPPAPPPPPQPPKPPKPPHDGL